MPGLTETTQYTENTAGYGSGTGLDRKSKSPSFWLGLGCVTMRDCDLLCIEASFEDFNPVLKQSGTEEIYEYS